MWKSKNEKRIDDLEYAMGTLVSQMESMDNDIKLSAKYILQLEENIKTALDEVVKVQIDLSKTFGELAEANTTKLDYTQGTMESMNILHENIVSIAKALNEKGILTEDDLK